MKTKYIHRGMNITIKHNDIGADRNVIFFRGGANLPWVVGGHRYIANNTNPMEYNLFPLEGNFLKNGFNEIIVAEHRRDYYVGKEAQAAIEKVAEITGRASGNITLGSCMGGFGAIYYSHLLNATYVAINPTYLPSDEEMDAEMAEMPNPEIYNVVPLHMHLAKWPAMNSRPECLSQKGYLFYDHTSVTDRIHAKFYRKYTKAEVINISFVGHGNYIGYNSIYKIPALVEDIYSGTFTAARMRANARAWYAGSTTPARLDCYMNRFMAREGATPDEVASQLEKTLPKPTLLNWLELGKALMRGQHFEQARAYFEKCYAVNPRNPEVIGQLALSRHKCGQNLDEVIDRLRLDMRERSLEANDVLVKILARLLFAAKRYRECSEAVPWHLVFADLVPSMGVMYARALSRCGKAEEALYTLHTLYCHYGDFTAILHLWASLLIRRGRFEEAETPLSRGFMEIAPEHFVRLYAHCLEWQGKSEQARSILGKGLFRSAPSRIRLMRLHNGYKGDYTVNLPEKRESLNAEIKALAVRTQKLKRVGKELLGTKIKIADNIYTVSKGLNPEFVPVAYTLFNPETKRYLVYRGGTFVEARRPNPKHVGQTTNFNFDSAFLPYCLKVSPGHVLFRCYNPLLNQGDAFLTKPENAGEPLAVQSFSSPRRRLSMFFVKKRVVAKSPKIIVASAKPQRSLGAIPSFLRKGVIKLGRVVGLHRKKKTP